MSRVNATGAGNEATLPCAMKDKQVESELATALRLPMLSLLNPDLRLNFASPLQQHFARVFACFFILFTLIAGGPHRHASATALVSHAASTNLRHPAVASTATTTPFANCSLCDWSTTSRTFATAFSPICSTASHTVDTAFLLSAPTVFRLDVPHRGLRGPPTPSLFLSIPSSS